MSNLERFFMVVYVALMLFSVFILIQTWGATNWVSGGWDSIAIGWIIGLNVVLGLVILYKKRKRKKDDER